MWFQKEVQQLEEFFADTYVALWITNSFPISGPRCLRAWLPCFPENSPALGLLPTSSRRRYGTWRRAGQPAFRTRPPEGRLIFWTQRFLQPMMPNGPMAVHSSYTCSVRREASCRVSLIEASWGISSESWPYWRGSTSGMNSEHVTMMFQTK